MELLACLQDVTLAAWDGYVVRFVTRQAPFPDTWQVAEVTNGAEAVLATVQPADQVDSGDRIGLRRVGSVIEAWHFTSGAWVKVLEATDATYTSGKLGIGITSNHYADGRLDDFGGGAEAPPGPPPVQSYGTTEDGIGRHGQTATGSFADPVNSRTGAFTTFVDDLELPGTGVSFAWSRSYTSADATVGRLGPGWTDSYSTSLAIQGNGDGSARRGWAAARVHERRRRLLPRRARLPLDALRGRGQLRARSHGPGRLPLRHERPAALGQGPPRPKRRDHL